MWLLIAEMVLALGAIVFIMWWTLRARVDHAAPPDEPAVDQPVAQTARQPNDDPASSDPGKPQT
ncbi:hypothetical protein NQT62_14250 [Limnobacter humi]|uniref:Uncharacterized protein n=1 Tax=Limnobacter humi TaxID=1778671 RepID=A0ABT1WJJ6_9BURK|nr:hypothetical protein [Limnobacter humi]MCQ8897599.1 hypothetical protein [Limnobacter humi]